MTIIIGLACAVLGGRDGVHLFAAPRGKDAFFVGTEWEAYAVVAMISLLAVGLVMTVVGITDWAQ
jgi:hypothetical protein